MKSLILTALLLIVGQGTASRKQGDMVEVKGDISIPLARIIAVPGDKVRVDNSGVYVNDRKVTWVTAQVLAGLTKPWQHDVIDKYLVASPAPSSNRASGLWAYVSADKLQETKP